MLKKDIPGAPSLLTADYKPSESLMSVPLKLLVFEPAQACKQPLMHLCLPCNHIETKTSIRCIHSGVSYTYHTHATTTCKLAATVMLHWLNTVSAIKVCRWDVEPPPHPRKWTLKWQTSSCPFLLNFGIKKQLQRRKCYQISKLEAQHLQAWVSVLHRQSDTVPQTL